MLGLRVAMLRKRKKLLQKDLARGIISVSHLSNFEKGRYNIGNDIFLLLSEKLEVPSDYLLKYSENNPDLDMKLWNVFKGIVLKTYDINLFENSKYNIINNLDLEISYFLLKASIHYKINKLDECKEIELNYLNFYLEYLIENQKSLSINLQIYLDYYLGIKAYANNNFKKSGIHFKKLSTLVTDIKLKSVFLYDLALIHYKIPQYYLAMEYANKAVIQYNEMQEWEKIAEIHIFKSVIYEEENLIEEAFIQLNKAENISENMNIKELKGIIYHNKGVIYEKVNHFHLAEKNYLASLNFKNAKNSYTTLIALVEIYLKTENYTELKKIFKKTLNIITNPYELHKLNTFHAEINFKEGNIEKFLKTLKCSLDFFEKNGFSEDAKKTALRLGEYFYEVRQYKSSAFYFKKILL